MEIQITGRHTNVTDAMKSHATSKLSKLERHNDMITRAEVVMNIESGRHMCEMIAHTKVGGQVIGKAEHSDMYAALDLLLEKMDQQLKKQKEKIKGERKHARTKASGETAGKRAGGVKGKAETEAPEDESESEDA